MVKINVFFTARPHIPVVWFFFNRSFPYIKRKKSGYMAYNVNGPDCKMMHLECRVHC